MLKKSTLVLSTIAVVSLATSQATPLASCDFEGNCSGYFYEDINAAFVDCFDANGVLLSRKESFYTGALFKDCNSTSFSTFEQSLNGTSIMASVPADQTVNYCDYYEIGQGYQFTQADNGIGLALLPDRIGSTADVYYKLMNSAPINLGWNWAELVQLVQALENAQCAPAGPTTPVSSGLSALLADLNILWTQWNLQGFSNTNVASWTKAELKYWLSNYVTYYNTVQAYVALGESATASLSEIESVLLSGAQLVFQNVNVTGTISFTDFWSPDFDLESVTVGEIINDLNVASNVVSQVETWFTNFVVEGGAILNAGTTISIESGSETTNITTGSGSSNVVVVDVPQNVEAIIAWITENFQAEVQALFPQYNFHFSTGATTNSTVSPAHPIVPPPVEPTNSTNSSNSTVSPAHPIVPPVVNTTTGDNSTDITPVNSTDNGTGPVIIGANGTAPVIVPTNSTSDNSTVVVVPPTTNSSGNATTPVDNSTTVVVPPVNSTDNSTGVIVISPENNSTLPVVNTTTSNETVSSGNGTLPVVVDNNSTETNQTVPPIVIIGANGTAPNNTVTPVDNSTVPPVVVIDNQTNSTSGNSTLPVVVPPEDNSTVSTNGTEVVNSTVPVVNTTTGTTSNTTVVDNSTVDTSGNSSTLGGATGDAPTVNTTTTDNSTTTTTDNSTTVVVPFSWATNYVLPTGCAYTDATHVAVKCSNGGVFRGVTYTFAELNEFWDFDAVSSCQDIQTVYASCLVNKVITNLSQCLRLSYYNTFQLNNDAEIYGWLSYDSVARVALLQKCSAVTGFTVTQANLDAAYAFNFPNLS